VLCFLPLGLVAVYYGLRVNSAVAGGRTADALRASRAGRRWLIATIVVGALLYLVLGSVFALLGAFSTCASRALSVGAGRRWGDDGRADRLRR